METLDVAATKPETIFPRMSPVMFAVGAAGLALFVWSLITGDSNAFSPPSLSNLALAIVCLCLSSADMYPRTPWVPVLRIIGVAAIYAALLFIVIPWFL